MSGCRKNYRFSIVPYTLFIIWILAACGGESLPGKGEKAVAVVTPTPAPTATPIMVSPAIPTCNQPVCLAPVTVPGVRPYIDTWNNVHILLPFSYTMSNGAQVGKYYDFVWGANPATVADLRAGNPNIFLSYYISLNRDSGLFNNLTLGRHHDLDYWKARHPDWILYKCDRVTPAYEIHDPNIPFDMTNEDFINWQVQTYAVPAGQMGYDAIAADNLNLDNAFGACGFYRHGQWVRRYTGQPNDPQWRQDLLFWVTEMQKKLHALPHPLALIPNLGYYGGHAIIDPQGYQLVQQIIQHVDGVLDESGFTKYGEGYLTDRTWVQTEQLILEVQQQHKPYYMIDEFPSAPVIHDDAMWALGSYLMSKDHLSYIFYAGPQQYGRDLRQPEYNIDIGMPVTDMFQDQNVYWRVYSNGLVVVNPSSTATLTVTINSSLPNYINIYGRPVKRQITLQPHSALIAQKKQ
jgi:hypothetical protein